MNNTTQVMPADVEDRVNQLRAEYGMSGVGIAHLLCDRHDPLSIAFVVARPAGDRIAVTYGELADESRRMATVLASRGVGAGDRVAVLMGKGRELLVTLVALWRLGAVHVPLFTAFAPPAIESRVRAADARVIVTDEGQVGKLAQLTGVSAVQWGSEMAHLVRTAEPWQAHHVGEPDDVFIQLYTSGTTGTPKGVPVPRRALAAFVSYLEFGLDVRGDDVYWNAADPGWAYGLYFAVVAPLAAGRSTVMAAMPFTPESTAALIESCGVTNFAGAPTMYRAMIKSGVRVSSLRRASSAGEPLTPDVNAWAPAALGCEVRDHYGQTELGMVAGNCWHDRLKEPIEEGSMGSALPGFVLDVRHGSLVLDTSHSPLMWFTGYVDTPDRTQQRFSPDGRWYLTGDAAERTGNTFSFAGRDDDVIIMAGYRISPTDIENILVRHPRVEEAAVVGRPDAIRGEVLEAFVVLSADLTPEPHAEDEEPDLLESQLRELVRTEYGAHAYPRTVHVVGHLPRTPSGKLQRFILRKDNRTEGN